MKKTFFKLIAVTLSALMLAGCSAKKNDSKPDTPDEPVLEQPFLEYYASDFKTIDVTLTQTDAPAPVEVKSLDISELDFGERVPACGNEESPLKGQPVDIFIDGKTIYFEVSYDYLSCAQRMWVDLTYDEAGVHEWSLFRYNTETGELKEIYSYSSENMRTEYLSYISRDKLYFSSSVDNLRCCTEYDTETQERKTVYESENLTVLLGNGDGYLYLEDKGDMMRYNCESGEMDVWQAELFESDDVKSWSFSEGFSRLLKPENSRKLDLVTDYYRLETGLTNADVVYTSQDTAILYTQDNEMLHTYNLDKKEHYITNVPTIANLSCYSNGRLCILPSFNASASAPLCFMPESGLAMTIDGLSRSVIGKSDNMMVFASYLSPDNDSPGLIIDTVEWFYFD